MVRDVRPNGLGVADCSAITGGGVRGSRRRPLSSAEFSRLHARLEDIRELVDHIAARVSSEAHEESEVSLANLRALDRLSNSWMAPDGRSVQERLSAIGKLALVLCPIPH